MTLKSLVYSISIFFLTFLQIAANSSSSTARSSMPSFPQALWQNYLQTHDYEIPTLFKFTPLRDQSTNNIKTSPLAKDSQGNKLFPIVVRCHRPEGCHNYNISVDGLTFKQMYAHPWTIPMLAWGKGYSGVDSNRELSPFNAVFIPPNENDKQGKLIENVNSIPLSTPIIYPTEPKLGTSYGDIIAVLYIDSERANNLPFRYNVAGFVTGQDGLLTFPSPLVTGEPYVTNGYVWKYIDSAAGIGSGSTWSQSYNVTTGITDTQTTSNAIQIGLKVSVGSKDTIARAEMSTEYTRTWGTSYSVSSSDSTTTELTCNNSNGPENSSKICSVYQLYGTTILTVPGISDRNIFAPFNNLNRFFTLSLGMQRESVVTEDTKTQLGVLYPIAGTLTPANSLNLGFPTMLIQY